MMDNEELTPKQWATVLLAAVIVFTKQHGVGSAVIYAKKAVEDITKETKDG